MFDRRDSPGTSQCFTTTLCHFPGPRSEPKSIETDLLDKDANQFWAWVGFRGWINKFSLLPPEAAVDVGCVQFVLSHFTALVLWRSPPDFKLQTSNSGAWPEEALTTAWLCSLEVARASKRSARQSCFCSPIGLLSRNDQIQPLTTSNVCASAALRFHPRQW